MKIKTIDPDADDNGIRLTANDLIDPDDHDPFDFAAYPVAGSDSPGELTVIIQPRRRSEYAAGKIAAVGLGLSFAGLLYAGMIGAILCLKLVRAIIGGLNAPGNKVELSRE